MWDKLNLPMFLFNVGLLTPIKIDSLIFLAKPNSNSLLLKREGNITWFINRANPQAGSTITVPPQAYSSWGESADAQAASTSLQAVSTISQGDSTVPKQGGTSQAGSSQMENTDSQAVSASPQVTSTNSQGDSAVQAGSPHAGNTDSQAVSASAQAASTIS